MKKIAVVFLAAVASLFLVSRAYALDFNFDLNFPDISKAAKAVIKLQKCKTIKQKLETKKSEYNFTGGKIKNNFKAVSTELEKVQKKLDEEGYDVIELKKDINIYNDKYNDFDYKYEVTGTKMVQASFPDCEQGSDDSMERMKDSLKEIRDGMKEVKALAKEVKKIYRDEIKPDLYTLSAQKYKE